MSSRAEAIGEASEETSQARVIDPPDHACDFARIGRMEITQANHRSSMEAAACEILIRGLDSLIPLGLLIVQLRADPADEERLIRSGEAREVDARPELGRSSRNLGQADQDDIAGRHGGVSVLMSASVYSGSSGP